MVVNVNHFVLAIHVFDNCLCSFRHALHDTAGVVMLLVKCVFEYRKDSLVYRFIGDLGEIMSVILCGYHSAEELSLCLGYGELHLQPWCILIYSKSNSCVNTTGLSYWLILHGVFNSKMNYIEHACCHVLV